MRFQQDTDTTEVEQLKLLKGKFDPKTLVAELFHCSSI